MKSECASSDIIIENEKITVTNVFFDHILETFDVLNIQTQKEIAEATGYGEKNLSYLLNKRPKDRVSEPMKRFAYLGYHCINNLYDNLCTFNKLTQRFEEINNIIPPQFKKTGIYYGYFRKSDTPNESKYHFILKYDGKTITIWSKLDSNDYMTLSGPLEENHGSYFCVLKGKHGKTNFFIGKKVSDQDEKVFIGTWSTKNNDICSALCLVYHIPNCPYDTLEKIKLAGQEIYKDILSVKPDDAEFFFGRQPHKFISEKTW